MPAKKTTIIVRFRQGFELKDRLYGWMNGELYRLPSKNTKSLKKMGMQTRKRKGLGYVFGKTHYSMQELSDMTVPIEYVHKDSEKNWNAYRPALSRTGFGIEPGVPWKDMDEKNFKR